MKCHSILFHPAPFSRRSGMYPLVEALGAQPLWFDLAWQLLSKRSWSLGQGLKRWGIRYYGSDWNALIPMWDELRLASSWHRNPGDIVHFVWGEFASPRWPALFRRNGAKLVGTFHCSARRLPDVLGRFKLLPGYDAITLMSETQRPYFLERGVPPERIHVILHGVDTSFFQPDIGRSAYAGGSLRGLLVGATERDHAFMASVLKALPDDVLHLTVVTRGGQEVHYRGAPHVACSPPLSDAGLLQLYQQSDLLVMPMFDCTANNAVMESMACGTPVMINRVGGVPEYVDSEGSCIMDGKSVDEWVERLIHLARHPEELSARRARVRQWVEAFDWKNIAARYRAVFAMVSGTVVT